MKKMFALIAACSLLAGSAWADGHGHDGGGSNFGAAVVYGLDLEGPGIQVSYYKGGAEDMIGFIEGFAKGGAKIGADFTYYLPDEPPATSITAFTVNVNLLSSIKEKEAEDLDIYAITGLNLTRTSVEVELFGIKADADSNDFNLNIGAGAAKPMGFGDLFGEAKYVVGGASQLVVGVGVRF